MAKKPTPKGWHKADIIAALHKRGISLSKLALTYGYERTSLCQALHHDRWPGAQVLIAEAIGLPPETIWPLRYPPYKEPRPVRTNLLDKRKCSASANAVKVNQAQAA